MYQVILVHFFKGTETINKKRIDVCKLKLYLQKVYWQNSTNFCPVKAVSGTISKEEHMTGWKAARFYYLKLCVCADILISFHWFFLSYTWAQFEFCMWTPLYIFSSLYSKTIIHQFFLINRQTQNHHVHTALYVMWSLPFSSACWSSSGQLVSAALYWEQLPHQVPVPSGTPPCWTQLLKLIRKHCCQGKAWWSRRGKICCPCG